MSLSSIYMRAETVGKWLLDEAGYEDRWMRSSMVTERRLRILNALPVDIHKQGDDWAVVFDFDSIGGTGWSEFDAHIRSVTGAKLAALPNLRQFARDHGTQYSALWRAKNDVGRVTDRIIEMVGACPDDSVEWPGGVDVLAGDFLSNAKTVRQAARDYLDDTGAGGTLTRGQFNALVKNLAEQRGGWQD